LRSAKHLHARDVAEVHRAADRAPHVNIIDIQADPGIHAGRTIALADATDVNLRGRVVAREGTMACELQVRRDLVQILGARNLLAL
jgi:hypothetical protein